MKQITIKRALKFKDGAELPEGSRVKVQPHPTCDTVCFVVTNEGMRYRLRYTSLFKAPTMASLERWVSNGVCPTPAGTRVEPDGQDSDGFPSWLRVMSFI